MTRALALFLALALAASLAGCAGFSVAPSGRVFVHSSDWN